MAARHQGTGTPGHQDTRTPGHQDTRAPGHQGTRTQGRQDTCHGVCQRFEITSVVAKHKVGIRWPGVPGTQHPAPGTGHRGNGFRCHSSPKPFCHIREDPYRASSDWGNTRNPRTPKLKACRRWPRQSFPPRGAGSKSLCKCFYFIRTQIS